MKPLYKVFLLVSFASILASCTIGNGWICGPQTPAAYCDREAYQRLMYPKTYGEYWAKSETSNDRASWSADWVACGGRSNGQYSGDFPERSSTAVMLAADQKKRQELSECMSAKGYHWTGQVAPY